MSYFVTGATGFIGGHLIGQLLKHKGTIFVLVREGSEQKVEALRERYHASKNRIVPIAGDLRQPGLGLSEKSVVDLKGKVDHFFHLAAIYDIADEDSERLSLVNVDGTRHAVAAAETIGAGCFHHMSSIAAAGLFNGYWREDMFEEAEKYDKPYFRTKHDSEGVVRDECKVPWRVYRPGIVVGHSGTGEMDKIDGPYYLFKFLKRVRAALPPWFPLIGIEGGRLNVVPVDFVVKAMNHIAHKKNLDGRCFHLTDPDPYRAGEVLNIFARAAHAPQFAMRIDYRMAGIIPKPLRDSLMHLPPVRKIIDTVLKDFGVPPQVLQYIDYPTRFDCRDALRELEGSGIACPRLEDYAPALWDYWSRRLDPDLFKDHTLKGAVSGKVVMITGASSGIGKAAALKVAKAGAKTLLVARSQEHLDETKAEIVAKGGRAWVYTADLSDESDTQRLLKAVFEDHGSVDVLVNNAGRSIRRSIHHSYERMHDFERTMQLNYFGAIRLILGVLPAMEMNGFGHIVNISSIGVLANAPRFSAYVASKSALDAFSRCARPEYLDKNVHFTTINMPLVRTPMINPTGFYDQVPALSPEEAADLVSEAIIERPKRIATRLGILAQIVTTLTPSMADIFFNTAYKLFPDTAPVAGESAPKSQAPSTEAVAFASLMRGVHW